MTPDISGACLGEVASRVALVLERRPSHPQLPTMLYNILPNALQYLLASWLIPHKTALQFELRHEHALSAHNQRVVFSDVKPTSGFRPGTFSIKTTPTTVHKPLSAAAARFRHGEPWDPVEVDGPDVQDREVLLLLAKMANNAYTEPKQKDWYDIGPNWNNVSPTGASWAFCEQH